MKKQLFTNALVILVSGFVGYILNCYYYNTFDPSKFDIAAKISTTVILVVLVFAYYGIKNEYDKEAHKRALIKNGCIHDWQPAQSLPEYYEECLICKGRRGKVKR